MRAEVVWGEIVWGEVVCGEIVWDEDKCGLSLFEVRLCLLGLCGVRLCVCGEGVEVVCGVRYLAEFLLLLPIVDPYRGVKCLLFFISHCLCGV